VGFYLRAKVTPTRGLYRLKGGGFKPDDEKQIVP